MTLALTPAAAARFGDPAIDAQLKAASSVADSYIVSQFTLPLLSWDMSLTIAVCSIAAYFLYVQFGFNPNNPADKTIEDRYKYYVGWLNQIRDNEIFPQWADSGVDPAVEQAGPYIESDTPAGFTDRGIVVPAWTPGTGLPGGNEFDS